MRFLVILVLVCVGIYRLRQSRLISVASKTTTLGTVFVNGTAPIGRVDDDFVCATIDWWPPQKCDYGTCSWGKASLLNLVSTLVPFHPQ